MVSFGILIFYIVTRKFIKQISVFGFVLFVFFLILTPLIYMTGNKESAEELASMTYVFLLIIFIEGFIKNFIEK